MSAQPLSVAIICFNEEKKIEDCIRSVEAVADEIVVVDSFSTDQTPELCQALGVKFFQHPFAGHIEQKNYALTLTSHELVLSLDADERLSPELAQKIKEIKQQVDFDGYYFRRLTHYAGRWIYHCGWYPDDKLRLFKKNLAHWGGHNPHDLIIMDPRARTTRLSAHILHYSYDSLEDHVQQTNRFTTIAAQAAHLHGVRSHWGKILTRPPLKFLRDYIWKRGFLDGPEGFMICVINALSAFLKYAKLWRLQRQSSGK